jgi:LexA-binding, inner membrane-associated putative hydrolase
LDIIAHGISTAAAVVAVRRKSHQPIRLPWALFFGVFPDLVPFTIPACLRIWWRLTGASQTLLPTANGPYFGWVWDVYNCTHSLLVFAVFFSVLWLVMRRAIVATLGWLLHILLDSFTHRGMFAIQFLWPASSVHLDGIPWETRWFLTATYGVLITVCFLLCRSRASSKVRRSADR